MDKVSGVTAEVKIAVVSSHHNVAFTSPIFVIMVT